MKIVWVSANSFGFELLKQAMETCSNDIHSIITLDESASTVMYDGIPAHQWDDFNIPAKKIINLNDELNFLQKLAPDVLMVCGWRQVIEKKILDIPKKGVIGFHPTLLPIGRGPAPIINSILSGFTSSGVTMFYMNDSLDAGDIIGQTKFAIKENDSAADVYAHAIEAGKQLITEFLPQIINETAPRIKQNNNEATYFEKRSLKDNEIDFTSESLEQIQRKIRALSKPYAGAYIKKEGKKLIIWEAELKNE